MLLCTASKIKQYTDVKTFVVLLKQLEYQTETLVVKEYKQFNTTSPTKESKFTICHHPKAKAGCAAAASSMND